MSSYVPSKLFKFIPGQLLKEVFEKCGVEFPFQTAEPPRNNSSAMAAAWKEHRADGYGGQKLAKLDAALQDICDAGATKSDINAVLKELQQEGASQLQPGFYDLNNYEKAARLFVDAQYETLWRHLLCVLEAKECSHTAHWHEFSGVVCDLNNLESRKAAIAEAVKDFFWEKKHSEHCRVEIFRKNDSMSYIFAELDDLPEYDEMKHPGDDNFEVRRIVHPFRVVVVCNSEKASLGFSAKVSKREVKTLAMDLIYAVNGNSGSIRLAAHYRYHPSRFLYHSHELRVLPGDGISAYHVTSITVAPRLNRHLSATFTGDSQYNPVEQAQIYMKSSPFGEQLFEASDIRMVMTVCRSASVKEKIKLRIKDDGSTVINLPDSIRSKVETILDRWEVRRHA